VEDQGHPLVVEDEGDVVWDVDHGGVGWDVVCDGRRREVWARFLLAVPPFLLRAMSVIAVISQVIGLRYVRMVIWIWQVHPSLFEDELCL